MHQRRGSPPRAQRRREQPPNHPNPETLNLPTLIPSGFKAPKGSRSGRMVSVRPRLIMGRRLGLETQRLHRGLRALGSRLGTPLGARIAYRLVRHRVRVEFAIYHATGADCKIVHIGDPFFRVAKASPLTGRVRSVYDEIKVVRPIDGPERQPHGQILARPRHYGEDFSSPLSVADLVEAAYGVDERIPYASDGRGEYVSTPPAVIRRPLNSSVNAAIIYYQAALARPLVVGHLLRRKGSRTPGGRSADQLAPLNLFLQPIVDPLGRLALQGVWLRGDGRTCRNTVVGQLPDRRRRTTSLIAAMSAAVRPGLVGPGSILRPSHTRSL